MTVEELKDFTFGKYHQQMGFTIENSYYSMEHQKKKDLQLLATKLTEKCLTLVMIRSTTNHF